MTRKSSSIPTPKISQELMSRLEQVGPRKKVRAIILLKSEGPEKPPNRRLSRAERQAAFEAIRMSAESSLADIDDILERYGARRLSVRPDALGSITVEATHEGLCALAKSDRVRAILEDQPVSLLDSSLGS
jgi:4'-phosphopantetheinyl transferase EntD